MPRILVVDEDPRSRKQTVEVLRHFHCTVRAVGEPDAALLMIRRIRLDAILVSANLPHMTATAFVDAVHQQKELAKVPVVVMAVTPRGSIDAIQAGARGCIRKPIDEGGLLSVMPPILKGGGSARRRSPLVE